MLGRRTAVLMLLAYGFLLTLAVAVHADVLDSHRGVDGHRRGYGDGQLTFDGAGPERWAARFRRERRAVVALRHELAARTSRVVWLVSAFECVHRYEGSLDGEHRERLPGRPPVRLGRVAALRRPVRAGSESGVAVGADRGRDRLPRGGGVLAVAEHRAGVRADQVTVLLFLVGLFVGLIADRVWQLAVELWEISRER